MSENKLIIPRKVKGFWELMPREQMRFSSLLQKIENVFKANSFVPLDTPVLEYSDALLAKSGGETDKQIFRFEKGDSDMCLRYDLTVPLARFVAMHENELNFPFKRYQIGKVYRGERPQKGRYREFYQCDADIIGDGELSLVADAECIALFSKCFAALDVDVEIKVSNRKILSGIIEEIGKTDLSSEILTVLDKLEKIPETEAMSELEDLGINFQNGQKLINLTKKSGKIEKICENLKGFCQNETFERGLSELEEVAKHLKSFGTKNVTVDLKIIRGHDYYTGTVFEAFLKGTKDAVGGGGRFENLCSYFSNKKMPGVGMSVGVTRLFDLLTEKGYFEGNSENEIEVAVLNFDNTMDESLSIVTKLRENGILADVLYENKTFKSKMKEANRREVKFALIVGEDEVKTQKFTLKNMLDGLQTSLSLSEIVKTVKDSRMCK